MLWEIIEEVDNKGQRYLQNALSDTPSQREFIAHLMDSDITDICQHATSGDNFGTFEGFMSEEILPKHTIAIGET